MTNEEYKARLNELRVMCLTNAHYHQCLESRFGLTDQTFRIGVSVLTVVGLVLAVPGIDLPWTGLSFAIMAAIAAFALTIVPFGDKEKRHGSLFRLWNDLHGDAKQEEMKTCDNDDDKDTVHYRAERLRELFAKSELLHGSEPNAYDGLFERCEGDAYEQVYGKGLRTAEAVERRRNELVTSSESSAVA